MSLNFKIKTLFLRINNSELYNDLINNYFIVGIFIVFLLYTINHLWFGFFLFGFSVFLYKKSKRLTFISIILSLCILTIFFIKATKPWLKTGEICGRIDFIDNREYSNRLTVNTSRGKVYIYDYQFLDLEIGMKIAVSGELISMNSPQIMGEFNYERYLKQYNFIGSIKAKKIEIIGKGFSIYWIVQKINDFFNDCFSGETLVFMKALLLGDDSSLNESFKESLIVNGTLHLFAISGSHINLFVLFLGSILKIFSKNEKMIENILCIFLIIYMIITIFSPSIVRASLMYCFLIINKRMNLRLSNLDIVTIVFILLIIINPYYMYNIGFILSFLISFMIVLINPIIKDKSIFYQSLIISTFAQLIALPITINLNYEINVLSPLLNIVSIGIVEGIILPLTIIVFAFPVLQIFYQLIITGFMNISIFASKVFNIPITFPYFNSLAIIIFYGLLICICSFRFRKQTIICLSMFLIIFGNIRKFDFYGSIYYLDLLNGESIIILEPYNKTTIVIDTGDGSNNTVTRFLKRLGIKSIDLLVLTHNHIDHNGEAIELSRQFPINNIIVHAYDNSDITRIANIRRVSFGDRIICGNLEFKVLNPIQESKNENDNSIVLYGEIGGLKHLFLGDASIDIEMNFADLSVDVLKVGHHGSNTSSSSAFINKLKPKYAIIQTGHIEKFGFPHQEVIYNLKFVEVFRTDINGSITYRYNKKSSIYKTMR